VEPEYKLRAQYTTSECVLALPCLRDNCQPESIQQFITKQMVRCLDPVSSTCMNE
jgi:hypothetical protein